MSKGLLISIGIIVLILLGVGGAVFISQRDSAPADDAAEQEQEEQSELGDLEPTEEGEATTSTEEDSAAQEDDTQDTTDTTQDTSTEDQDTTTEEESSPPPADEPAPEDETQGVAIVINADDNGYTSDVPLEASAGASVEITFNVSTENTYYDGLDFRSSAFQNTGTIEPGSSGTVTFTAPQSDFIFNAWWPDSNVKKWDATFTVN